MAHDHSAGSQAAAASQSAGPQTDSLGTAERREIRFAGRVQGVGFRYTARNMAVRLPVTGYVRNLPDGTVELVVEGAQRELERLLAGIEAELGRFIEHRDEALQPATGEFPRFEIKF